MRFIHCLLLLISLPILISSFNIKKKKCILVFSKTEKFRHTSIPKGKEALLLMGKQHNFIVDTTEDASLFTTKNLRKYDVVVSFPYVDRDSVILDIGEVFILVQFAYFSD